MVHLIIPKEKEAPAKKGRQARRSKEDIAAEREAAMRRRAEREARAKQREQEAATHAAQMHLINEAKAKRVKAAVEQALRETERIEQRIKERAGAQRGQWARERKEEGKALRRKVDDLRRRHSIAREEPPQIAEERQWLAQNDRSEVEIPEAEPEYAIPGFVALSRPRAPMVDIDDPPAEWNDGWLMKRLVDAYRTLSLLPSATRPAGFGRAWPSYVAEFADAVAQTETHAGRDRNRVKPIASIEEIAQMERVFAWPSAQMSDMPAECRALFQWANAKAIRRDQRALARSFGMSPATFRRYRRDAATLLCARLRANCVPVF